MVSSLILIIGALIIAIDIASHVIPNQLSLALALLLLVNPDQSSLDTVLFEFLILAILGSLLHCGAGDIKLLLVLVVTNSRMLASEEYLNGLFISIFLTVAISALYHRSLKGNIPFAPAILGPFVWCYLAI